MPLLHIDDYEMNETRRAAALEVFADVKLRGQEMDGIDVVVGADIYQRIALLVPENPDGAVLAFMHGGRASWGWKECIAFMAEGLNPEGIILASIGHRLYRAEPEAADLPMEHKNHWPAGRDDCMAAIAWLYANVAEHGGDPRRIFVGGHSSGGHLAALMGVRRDWQAGLGLPDDVIRGCLPISGIYDHSESANPIYRSEVDLVDISPLHTIHGTPPPFLLFTGDSGKQEQGLRRLAGRFAEALQKAGGEASQFCEPGFDHFQAVFEGAAKDGPWTKKAAAWMKAH
jgi:acetyl esterase/lipase